MLFLNVNPKIINRGMERDENREYVELRLLIQTRKCLTLLDCYCMQPDHILFSKRLLYNKSKEKTKYSNFGQCAISSIKRD